MAVELEATTGGVLQSVATTAIGRSWGANVSIRIARQAGAGTFTCVVSPSPFTNVSITPPDAVTLTVTQASLDSFVEGCVVLRLCARH